LASMHIYWASVFSLPKTVIKDIDKVLKGYLWCNGEISKGKAKVDWKNVCKPRSEGGLGIKNLDEWNSELLSKHLWNVISNKDSLWVDWIKMLDLRDIMRKQVKYKIGDGKSVFLWHDKWWNDKCLNEIILTNILLRTDMMDCKIKGCKDSTEWTTIDGCGVKYSVHRAWHVRGYMVECQPLMPSLVSLFLLSEDVAAWKDLGDLGLGNVGRFGNVAEFEVSLWLPSAIYLCSLDDGVTGHWVYFE
ncbi:hypothetical protein Tco_0592891, partial [Tanacetum coccineum]